MEATSISRPCAIESTAAISSPAATAATDRNDRFSETIRSPHIVISLSIHPNFLIFLGNSKYSC